MAICITVAPCGHDKPENGSKCCTAFLFPPLSGLFFFSFFQCHVEMCLVKLSNTANQEFSLSPAVSLDPKLPFSTPYSRTLCVSAAAASQHSRISHYVCPKPSAPHI